MSKKTTKTSEAATKTFEELAVNTEAGKIWSEIKDLSIDMFALPNQFVFQHCEPVMVEPSKLYVVTKSTSVLPSLEASCGKKFEVDLLDRWVTVSRKK